MRFERTITSISWIPSDALAGMAKLGTKMGVAHDDLPPPDHIGTDDAALDELRASDRFRFANRLRAWVEVEDGKIVDHGLAGAGLMGATTLDLGVTEVTLQAVALPDRTQPSPTSGGR